MNDAIRAQVSAFVDGELPQSELELLLRRMSQDEELRQLAAEYLVIRRVMRGERSVAGLKDLRGRVAAAIDDQDMPEAIEPAQGSGASYLKPLAGFAIAATVALAAVFAFQQMNGVVEETPAEAIADTAESAYTVPDQIEDQLREYYLRHSASSAHIGADRFNARLVTLELRDGVVVEIEEPVPEEDGEDPEQAPQAQ